MTVVVEPVLTEEKLRSLLAEAHEQPTLDYKEQLDLSERRDVVELVKDIAAMQSNEAGGYIVIGADDRGNVVNKVTADQAKLFDEATLRSKLKRYLAEPFEVRTAVHAIDQATVVLVYVGPNPKGWCIFVADGEYEVAQGSGKKRKVTVFRVGDVFVRHGTASERWQDADRERLLAQVVARQKEGWRTELRTELLSAIDVGQSAQGIAQMPVSAVTWQLDADTFDQLVTELMRRDDDIPLRRLLVQARSDAADLLSSDLDELRTLLDRITSLAALALTYERSIWFAASLNTLVGIYELGVDAHGNQRRDIPAVQLWLHVLGSVYGLGGLAVRLQNWDAVRTLADRAPAGRDINYYGSWLRHGLTEAARSQLLDDEENRGLIERGHNVIRRVEALHPDVDPEAEEVLSSLCQFDALGALVVIGEQHSTDSSIFYTNFARYYTARTEPALSTIIKDKEAREKLFDGDDEFLAQAIRALLKMASGESMRFSGWTGLEGDTVAEFLNRHPQSDAGS